MKIAAINAGSTSLKFAVFERHGDELRLAERGRLAGCDPQAEPFQRFVDRCDGAFVHRIVHSGGCLRGPVRIDPKVVQQIGEAVPLAPLHQPVAMRFVEAIAALRSDAEQFACFDTDFFADLPPRGYELPIGRTFRDAGVRRYGFHGLAYASVLQTRPSLAEGRTVLCHLGGGTSAAALIDGRPVATTMGMTPNGGLPMATRSGDLDPGVADYLRENTKLSSGEIAEHLVMESGLLGLSELSGDVGALIGMREREPRADLALTIYVDAIAEQIAGYAVRLGGLDHLSFSGGVSEFHPTVPREICDRLAGIGLLDRCQTRGVVTSCDEERVMAFSVHSLR